MGLVGMSGGGTGSPAARRRRAAPGAAAAILTLGLLVAIVYLPALGNGFVSHDDPEYITRNPRVLTGLGPANAAWAFRTFHAGNWHPLTWISHQFDASLFGLAPAGHHAVSVLLHLANAALLWRLLAALTGAGWPSLVVAMLFAVHPLHVESVAWASERKDLLSAALLLLAGLAWVTWVRRRSRVGYAAALAAYALSLLAKPMGVSFPFLLLLLDAWPLARFAPRRAGRPASAAGAGPAAAVILEKTPFLLLAAASSVVTWIAQERGGMFYPIPFPWRLGNAAVAYARYLGKTLWPTDLAVFYPHPGGALAPAAVFGAAALLAAATILAVVPWRRLPFLAVGWLWFVGTLLPVIGLAQVGNQAMADRYTYLPLTGVFVALAWGGAAAARRYRLSRVLAAAAAVLVVGLLPVARRQVGVWRDDASLFGHALAVTEGNWLAHNGLGDAAWRSGRYAEAAAHFREAVRINPGFFVGWANLGQALASLGDPGAPAAFAEAIRLEPAFVPARAGLGVFELARGNLPAAEREFLETLRLDPAHVDARVNLGVVAYRRGDRARAAAWWREALALDPRQPLALENLKVLAGER
jgi:tetratricopeptide (TPR) repeat protein